MSAPGYLHSLFSLDGRCAVVTGAARGNGLAIARALSNAGASVLLVDILPLAKSVAFVRQNGCKAEGLVEDLTQPGAATRVLEAARSALGSVDILVNNAGVSFGHDPLDYPDELWERTYQVNLKAPFELSRACAGWMKDHGGGAILNITSLNAELAFPGNPAYVAFKGALRQLTRSMALDFGSYNIRVNSVAPGYIRTDMTRKSFDDPELHEQRKGRTALNRWGQPEDLAGAVIFLASPSASYVTGIDLYVDGGWLIKGL